VAHQQALISLADTRRHTGEVVNTAARMTCAVQQPCWQGDQSTDGTCP
jgi:hypothetical protein